MEESPLRAAIVNKTRSFARARVHACRVRAVRSKHKATSRPEIDFRRPHSQLRIQGTERRCGEMADATDLKSVGP
jgi:hypothetical protein